MTAPRPPSVRLCVGVTGHREDNPAFADNLAGIDVMLTRILDIVAAAAPPRAPTGAAIRLHSLLAEGADQMAATSALARGWELVAPLPFGLALNIAINSRPEKVEDARVLLSGAANRFDACGPEVRERALRIAALVAQARVFELADRDALLTQLFLDHLQNPHDPRKASTYAAESSVRAALAGRVMIEQSDLLIAVWDGTTSALVGGTGHTINVALETGTPVVWIDANEPAYWRILTGPEALVGLRGHGRHASDPTVELQQLVRRCLVPAVAPTKRTHGKHHLPSGHESLEQEALPMRSNRAWHLYRRIEALFGGDSFRARFRKLRQTYETPDAIAGGSAARLLSSARALPGLPPPYIASLIDSVLRRFAWADGVSSYLSDRYRGGMVANFLLAPMAIVGGIAYLPLADYHGKWLYALFELLLLLAILAITITGQKRRWHERWFETRRVAEYLRHGPMLLLMGVARAPARWPLGTETSWPEWYARHALRDVGLPQLAVAQGYLRQVVRELLHSHVIRQRDYHVAKAKRLAAVHRNLDRFAEFLFILAVVSVATYLLLKGGGLLHLWPRAIADELSYVFTFLGVLLPIFGGAVAGIRYFGDFERFAAISRVAAEQLQAIDARIVEFLAAPEGALDYGRAADLAHATDNVVVGEIESWQSVFGGKHVTVPV